MTEPLLFIVENEISILELYQQLFLEEGYRVRGFNHRINPEDVRLVQRLQPDLLIIDQLFGSERPGWKFLQAIRQQPETAHIPIIICSADISFMRDCKLQQELSQFENCQVVFKPFELNTLLQAVAKGLSFQKDPLYFK